MSPKLFAQIAGSVICGLSLLSWTPSERDDYLWKIGSGSNWLSYHLSIAGGLQKFLLQLPHSPVRSRLPFAVNRSEKLMLELVVLGRVVEFLPRLTGGTRHSLQAGSCVAKYIGGGTSHS